MRKAERQEIISAGRGGVEAGFISGRGKETRDIPGDKMVYRCGIVLGGYGTFCSRGSRYSLGPGSVYQCLPGDEGHLEMDGEEQRREFCITISKNAFDALACLHVLQIEEPVFQVELELHMLDWMESIEHDMDSQREFTFWPIENYFNVQRFLVTLHSLPHDPVFATSYSLVEAAKGLMYRNLDKNIVMTELAEELNVSYEKLRKVFLAGLGITPYDFLMKEKFHYAKMLLHEGLSVREVASRLGYSDQFSFSKQFKKVVGTSPNAYKCER